MRLPLYEPGWRGGGADLRELAPRGEEVPDRFLDRARDLRRERLARHFGRLAVRLEEVHAVRALRQMPTEPDLLVGRQLALEIIHAELDELVTADHGMRPPCGGAPAFPAFRWPPRTAVSQNHTQTTGFTATHVRKPLGRGSR